MIIDLLCYSGFLVFPCAGPTGYGRGTVWNMTTCEKGIAVKPRKGAALLWYTNRCDE